MTLDHETQEEMKEAAPMVALTAFLVLIGVYFVTQGLAGAILAAIATFLVCAGLIMRFPILRRIATVFGKLTQQKK